MTPEAAGSVLIPISANMPRGILGRFIKEFPFSLGWVLSKLWRSITLWRKYPELVHVSQIEIEDLARFFKLNLEGAKHGRRVHKWFVHYGPMVPLIKAGILKTRLTVNEYSDIEIPIAKKNACDLIGKNQGHSRIYIK